MDATGGVTAGFLSFTEVTDRDEHRAYNQWHQLDHLPEQYSLPGVRWGQRWVSTPACRRARAVSRPELDAAHYLTLYLLSDAGAATLDAFDQLGHDLYAVGRFHRKRRSLLAGPAVVTGAWAAPRVLVSPAVVPFRPHRGVYVVVGHGEPGVALDGAALVTQPGVAGVWTLRTLPDERRRWGTSDEHLVVCYLDDEPLEVADALGALVVAEPTDTVVLAGPFETITPWRWDWFDEEPPG